ncbi:MAG: histidine phosphatase family protein [Deltaproteobacteria bacterium]|nr:histidine phosphatase family protein [Deltaproteobacteria bacterium]
MQFVFVRHGQYDGKGLSRAERKLAPLNDKGRTAAQAAGEYMKQENITPDFVITTDAERTKETARIILDALEVTDVEPQAKVGGFRKGKATIERKLGEWLGETEPAVVMFVGHLPSQQYCVSDLPGSPNVPNENRSCVLLYERTSAGWSLLKEHPGVS